MDTDPKDEPSTLPERYKNATPEDLGISSEKINYALHKGSVSVGRAKVDRMFIKNQRRMDNGLPPLPYNQL